MSVPFWSVLPSTTSGSASRQPAAFSRGPTVRARVVPAARRRGSLRRAPGPPGYINPEDAKPRRPPQGPRRPTCTWAAGRRPLGFSFGFGKPAPPFRPNPDLKIGPQAVGRDRSRLELQPQPSILLSAQSHVAHSGPVWSGSSRGRITSRSVSETICISVSHCAGKVISANA